MNPGEESKWLDGYAFEATLAQLQSWDWIYGNSPKFSVPMETDDGTVLRLDCERGRVAALVQERAAFGTPVSLLQRITATVTGNTPPDPWLQKLNDAIKGSPLAFAAINKALTQFQMSPDVEGDPMDPFDRRSMIIDRIRAMATCF